MGKRFFFFASRLIFFLKPRKGSKGRSQRTSKVKRIPHQERSHCKFVKMSTTSQKHRNFVAEPMNVKPVTDLAGKGFDKAYVVLGQFLVLKKSKDLFIDWLKDDAGANTKQATDCYQCLSDWCDEFL